MTTARQFVKALVEGRAPKVGAALLQASIYQKAHLAIEQSKSVVAESLLNEADPHPRVEFDRNGQPVVPSEADYAGYFAQMQDTHVRDQKARAEQRWAEVTGQPESERLKAEKKAIENELAAVKKALAAD